MKNNCYVKTRTILIIVFLACSMGSLSLAEFRLRAPSGSDSKYLYKYGLPPGSNFYQPEMTEIVDGKDITINFVYLTSDKQIAVMPARYSDKFGFFKIGDQFFYIYSPNGCNNTNSVSYLNNQLDLNFVDFNGDGFKDIIISGVVDYTSSVEPDEKRFEDVFFIYLCDFEAGKFTLFCKKASFDIEKEGDVLNAKPIKVKRLGIGSVLYLSCNPVRTAIPWDQIPETGWF